MALKNKAKLLDQHKAGLLNFTVSRWGFIDNINPDSLKFANSSDFRKIQNRNKKKKPNPTSPSPKNTRKIVLL
jgi:hypothetical protein